MSKKYVLYSGGQMDENRYIHQHLAELVEESRKSFTYVPYCYDQSDVFFRKAVRRYQRFGFDQFQILHLDRPSTKDHVKHCLSADVIYLAGGNTFYMLHHLKKSGLFGMFQEYSRRGGILAGLSAGAIIMTPRIDLAGTPEYDADDNEVGLRNLRGLNLVDFEFFPHFRNSKRFIDSLSKYSLTRKNPVYALKDGGGVIVNERRKTFIGDAWIFWKGNCTRL